MTLQETSSNQQRNPTRFKAQTDTTIAPIFNINFDLEFLKNSTAAAKEEEIEIKRDRERKKARENKRER
jgi:hypothetical protein